MENIYRRRRDVSANGDDEEVGTFAVFMVQCRVTVERSLLDGCAVRRWDGFLGHEGRSTLKRNEVGD